MKIKEIKEGRSKLEVNRNPFYRRRANSVDVFLSSHSFFSIFTTSSFSFKDCTYFSQFLLFLHHLAHLAKEYKKKSL